MKESRHSLSHTFRQLTVAILILSFSARSAVWSSLPTMQRGMFVLIDSDVDEAELEFISKKLKKLHKRKLNKIKEQKKNGSSMSPSPNPSTSESDTASVSSMVSSTTGQVCAQVQQGRLKRKRVPAETETLAPKKKSLRGKPDVRNDSEGGSSSNSDGGKSLLEKDNLHITKLSTVVQNGDCIETSTFSQVNCSSNVCDRNWNQDFTATETKHEVITVVSEDENGENENNSHMQTFTKSKTSTSRTVTSLDGCVSRKGKEASESLQFGRISTLTQASHIGSIARKQSTLSSSCLTKCKSCAAYSLPCLSDEDHSEMMNYIALDCEFVGVGPGKTSALGRCSIVDHQGIVLFDRFVKPEEPVTDYRTPWSGLRPRDIKQGIPFVAAQEQISQLLQGKVVVGHAVYNDFKVLGIPHPVHDIRDTASCKLLREMADLPGGTCALRRLTQALLGRTIQKREHCSVTDARACMDLFRLVRTTWEPVLLAKVQRRRARNTPGVKATEGEPGLNSYLDDQYWPSDMFTESY